MRVLAASGRKINAITAQGLRVLAKPAALAGAVVFAALPQVAQATETDVAVLQSEMSHVKAAIIRIDKLFERMDKRLVRLEEISIRLDQRMNALQMQNQFVIIPLLFLTLAALIGLLTKGVLWGVAP